MQNTTKLWDVWIKKDINKWKILICSFWLRCPSSPKSSLQTECTSIKTPATYFVNTGKLILMLIWKGKRVRIPTQYWRNSKVEDWNHLTSDYCSQIIIKLVMSVRTNETTEQTKIHINIVNCLWQRSKDNSKRERSFCTTKGTAPTDIQMQKKKRYLVTYLTPFKKKITHSLTTDYVKCETSRW